MEWLENLFSQTYINSLQIFIRLIFEYAAGWPYRLGTRKPPATCRITYPHPYLHGIYFINDHLYLYTPDFSKLQNGDPGRIAAQVVSGIGFLGAGLYSGWV